MRRSAEAEAEAELRKAEEERRKADAERRKADAERQKEFELLRKKITDMARAAAARPPQTFESQAVMFPGSNRVVMFHKVKWAKEEDPVVLEECAARAAYCLAFKTWNDAKRLPDKEPQLPEGDAGKADLFDKVASLFRAGNKAPHKASNEFTRLLAACDHAVREANVSDKPANHVLCFHSHRAVPILAKAFICTPGVPISLATFTNK